MLSNILKRKLSESQLRYLISRRYGFFVYLLILNKKETYMADIEKSFIKFGSRSTMVKVIKELEHLNLIESSKSTDSRIKLLKIKN
jgi:DNA-binding PadR family transcriptional regulator